MVLLLVALVAQDTTIRSFLKTVEIASGKIETVYSADRRFEAPNWSRDGRYFLINSEGRLYRLTAGASQLAELPVILATPRINNDHGISPDGKSLVISHEPTEDWLTSSVYTLPIAGGTPKRITTKAPSFWHGWSPDGKTLAFVGRRDGEFDIYTISVDGGDERRITTCKGLDDGPDYSPDGHWLVFLSFVEDQGQDHPFGRQVKLRLMDLRDRSVRDVTPEFFGGQGTINVPSWAPDSKRVAFVAYERHAAP